MKFSTKTIIINPEEPVKQIGFIHQKEKISTVHDNLCARFMLFEDDFIYIHVSVDVLGFPLSFQEELKNKVSPFFEKKVFLTISATHTHYSGDTQDNVYKNQLLKQFTETIKNLTLVDYNDLKISFKVIPFDLVGKSRISNHQAKVLLSLTEIYNQEECIANIINYNCHPTTLSGKDTNYFSSEFPGYLLKKLKDRYPDQFFTYLSGAMGDISTRFTRNDQTYASVITLGDMLYNEIIKLKNTDKEIFPLTLSYNEKCIKAEHEFKEININEKNLTPRELEVIEYGKTLRQTFKEHPEKLMNYIKISCLQLNKYHIIFIPNELFSSYYEAVDTNYDMLACYSNGYGPYMLKAGEFIFTYEAFMDTFSDYTKNEIYETIKKFSHNKA